MANNGVTQVDPVRATIYCNYCRQLNRNDAIYCSACGRTIRISTERAEQSVQSSETPHVLSNATSPSTQRHQEYQNHQQTTPSIIVPPYSNELQDLAPKALQSELGKRGLGNVSQATHVKTEQELVGHKRKGTTASQITAGTIPSHEPRNNSTAERLNSSVPTPALAPSVTGVYKPFVSPANAVVIQTESKPCEASPLPVYGTIRERSKAYFADLIVIYLIVIAVYFVPMLFKLSLSTDQGTDLLVIYVVMFVYMIVAQSLYHTTVGKYVLDLEVRSQRSEQKYPAFWRIVVRETVGRVLSLLFWGAGYWLGIKKPRQQAWSDRMAGTVVTVRPTNPVFKKALKAFIAVAFVVDAGVLCFGQYLSVSSPSAKHATAEEPLASTAKPPIDWDAEAKKYGAVAVTPTPKALTGDAAAAPTAEPTAAPPDEVDLSGGLVPKQAPSTSTAESETVEDGLSPETKKRLRETMALQLSGAFQRQDPSMRVDVTGVHSDVLVIQIPSMNDGSVNDMIHEFSQGDTNFWNAMRLLNYRQVEFSGKGYKKIIPRKEFLNYGKNYEGYVARFLEAVRGPQATAQGDLAKP